MFKIETTPENAVKFKDWITNRGGVAHWKSANLSNPSATWSTPATIRRGDCENPNPHLLSREAWERIYSPGVVTEYEKIENPSISLEDFRETRYQEHVRLETKDENEVIPYPKVNWQMQSAPEFVVTDPKEIGVATYKTVETIRIALRMGGSGLSIKLTDHSSAKVREACDRHEGSTYIFGGDDGKDCYIQVPERIVPLDEFTT